MDAHLSLPETAPGLDDILPREAATEVGLATVLLDQVAAARGCGDAPHRLWWGLITEMRLRLRLRLRAAVVQLALAPISVALG